MPFFNAQFPHFLQDYQAIVDAEWNILYDKLEKIYQSGAKVVLSKLPIGDVATQYFADRDLFCAGRVQEEDLKRTMMVGKSSNVALFPHFCLFRLLRDGFKIVNDLELSVPACNVTSRPVEALSRRQSAP